MIEQTKLIPTRRFKEFKNTYAWEQRKFDEEVEFYGGLTYSPTNVSKSGTLVLRSSNVKNGEIVSADNVYVKSEIVNSSNVQKGDIIVVVRNGSRSLIGKHAKIKKDMTKTVIGAFMTGIRSQQSNFINALLDTHAFKVEVDKNLGATINQITNGMFRSMQFLFPESEEQKKIGLFFAQIDQLIINQQHKLEKTKALKAAYLSEMFPAEGEFVPKRRFTGFNAPWKFKTVNDLADKYDNLRVPITASDRILGNTPYYGANGIQGYVEGFTHDGEYILVAEDGANDLKNYPIQYVNGKVWVNNHAHVLQAKSKVSDNKFLMNAMKHMNIEPYLVGGGRAKLNADVMMNISFLVPELAEQKLIGSFFSRLDNHIVLHQRKLEKLQNLKKAYLTEMFI